VNVRALFVDAVGTLLKPRAPVALTYAQFARKHGHEADPARVQVAFRAALRARRPSPDMCEAPTPPPPLQAGDGRAFWREVVAESLSVRDEALFEDLYLHYASPKAWWIPRDALEALGTLSRQGVRLAIVSNFDTRLREVYQRLALDRLFSALICSAEVEVEKPHPEIFRTACRVVGIEPHEAVHLGDDPLADLEGASRAGLYGLLHEDDDAWRTLPATIARLRRYAGRPGGTVFGT
jgi:REG-2-like HAD superfamily hydrolase